MTTSFLQQIHNRVDRYVAANPVKLTHAAFGDQCITAGRFPTTEAAEAYARSQGYEVVEVIPGDWVFYVA